MCPKTKVHDLLVADSWSHQAGTAGHPSQQQRMDTSDTRPVCPRIEGSREQGQTATSITGFVLADFNSIARSWGMPGFWEDKERPSPFRSPTSAPSHEHQLAPHGWTLSTTLSSPLLHKFCSETGPTHQLLGPGGH